MEKLFQVFRARGLVEEYVSPTERRRPPIRPSARDTVVNETMITALADTPNDTHLPDILNPDVCLTVRETDLPEEFRSAALSWVFDAPLDFLETQALRNAELSAEEAAREEQQKALQRQVIERGVAGHQWRLGEHWAARALMEWDMQVPRASDTYRRFSHHALRAVLRAYAAHDQRCRGEFAEDGALVARPLCSSRVEMAPQGGSFAPTHETQKASVAARASEPTVAVPELAPEPPEDKTTAREPECGDDQATGRSAGLDDLYSRAAIELVGHKWSKNTINQGESSVNLFKEFVGDIPFDKISALHGSDYRFELSRMPVLHGKSIFAGLDPRSAVELADSIQALHSAAKTDRAAREELKRLTAKTDVPIERLIQRTSTATINRHLSFMRQLVKYGWQSLRGETKPADPFDGLNFSKAEVEKGRTPRQAWLPPDVRALLQELVGRPKDNLFWGIILGGLHPLRRSEVAQLKTRSIVLDDAVPHIRLSHADMKLKTSCAERAIPIHPLALALGFAEFVAEMVARGCEHLFPEFLATGSILENGRNLTRQFVTLCEEMGHDNPAQDYHAFRMTLNTDMMRAGWSDAARHYLMGHKHENVNVKNYFGGFRVEDLLKFFEDSTFAREVKKVFLQP